MPRTARASDLDAHPAAAPTASDTRPAPGQVRVGPLQPVAALLREHGVAPADVLAACGLPPDTLDDADRRITFLTAGELVWRCAETLRRPDFALLVGRRFDLSMLGLLGELMRRAPRVDAALQILSRYFHLQDRGSVPYVRQVDDRLVALGYAVYDADTPGLGLVYDLVLAIGMVILRTLCGPAFRVSEVQLAHSRPARALPYRQCFGAPVVFDAPHSELQFDASWLAAPVAGAAPSALDGARRAANDAEDGDLRRWTERAHAAVRVLVMDGSLSSKRVAQALGMHERTLRRRLAEESASLQQIIAQVRFDLARQLLRETRLPIGEIAATLGYAHASVLVRCFSGWAGTTPGRWRDALVS